MPCLALRRVGGYALRRDHKGYVYEKAAILAYLHNKTKGQVHLAVDSPNVGAPRAMHTRR